MNDKSQSVSDLLRKLSAQDFLNVGMHQVAYIRPISLDHEKGYGVYAADGTQLSVMDSFATAMALAKNHDLEPVTVH